MVCLMDAGTFDVSLVNMSAATSHQNPSNLHFLFAEIVCDNGFLSVYALFHYLCLKNQWITIFYRLFRRTIDSVS